MKEFTSIPFNPDQCRQELAAYKLLLALSESVGIPRMRTQRSEHLPDRSPARFAAVEKN